MKHLALLAIMAVTTLGAPTAALAQGTPPADPADKDKKADDKDKKPPEEEFDPSLMDDPEGENPNDPDIDLVGDQQTPPPKKRVPPKVRAPSTVGYPMMVGHRPITLKKYMVEPIVQYGVVVDPFIAEGVIGGRFGVTDQIQAGLRYGFGSVGDDLDGYEVGKVVSLDFEYLIQPWVAGQLSVPILFDPISVGVVLGAPMKFIFFEKLTLQFFRDLVSFRTNRFVPDVESAAATAALIAFDATDTNTPDGAINVQGSALYQQSEKLAFELRAGLNAIDFELNSDSPKLFDLGAYYTHSAELDFGGRIGFRDLSDTGTFGAIVFVQYRAGFDKTPKSLAAQVSGEVAAR